jgi:aminoglycoside 6'-N-acetyltransferase I
MKESSHKIVVRRADITDVEDISQLLYELYVEDMQSDYTMDELLEEVGHMFFDYKNAFFLADVKKSRVGVAHCSLREEYVNGKEYEDACGYLEAIYVKEKYRKHGIGKKLASAGEEWSQGHECREFLSDCLLENIDSYNYHIKLSFAETERNIFFRKEKNKKKHD